MNRSLRNNRAMAAVSALAIVTVLAGCGSDEPEPSATAAASTSTSTVTPTPTKTATPSATPTATPKPTATPTPKPSALPTDDENGELAGQLIIEYPGKPLKRTTSTAKNNDVVDLQVRLNEVGFPVDTDGRFDAETERVVIRFQKDNGLTADGVVGPSTWAALFTFEG